MVGETESDNVGCLQDYAHRSVTIIPEQKIFMSLA